MLSRQLLEILFFKTNTSKRLKNLKSKKGGMTMWAICYGVAWHPILWGEIVTRGESIEIKDDSGRTSLWDPKYIKEFSSAEEAKKQFEKIVSKEVDSC